MLRLFRVEIDCIKVTSLAKYPARERSSELKLSAGGGPSKSKLSGGGRPSKSKLSGGGRPRKSKLSASLECNKPQHPREAGKVIESALGC